MASTDIYVDNMTDEQLAQAVKDSLNVAAAEEEKQQNNTTSKTSTTTMHANVKINHQMAFTDGTCQLSAIDIASLGRSVSMCWFYTQTLDPDTLLASLAKTLITFPILSGRYNGTKPPTHVNLNNMGIPTDICLWNDTTQTSTNVSSYCSKNVASSFSMWQHVPFVPIKDGMDPDKMKAEEALFKVKIITFPAGGTSIGILAQHGVVDAESIIDFMTQWSRIHTNLGLDPIPNHDRCSIVDALDSGEVAYGDANNPPQLHWNMQNVPVGENIMPAFAPCMPKIMGDAKLARSCIVPLTKDVCQAWKEAANEGLSENQFVSTDDVLTARIWQGLCEMRCKQLDIATDNETILTTCNRACNFRKRTEPPLGKGYCGNATTSICTTMTIKQLLSSKPSIIALQLRTDLHAVTSLHFAARVKWLKARHQEKANPTTIWDKNAMTFIVSSWNFAWEQVNFTGDDSGTPFCYDHGCLVPVTAVLVPRAKQDGMNVYVSGPDDLCLKHFEDRVNVVG